MSTPVPNNGPEKRTYRAPKLTSYGSAIKLTAGGSKSSSESNGGSCGDPNTKVRC
jgi:hypothetical protein